jgi:hypothetical protein
MFSRITRQRLGSAIGHTKCIVGNIDRGIRTAARVFHATKDLVPEGRMKKAAEKGLSDYEAVREKIRAANP